ncbi:MAG TPA: lipoprotein-releasing ABC transporter ATP-binding protein LolD [Wenzhouxiangella sp.]|nr:lipoprotein-releasing ABC transporter ATP-binding protein LolD [Wenzhouxiangella sp.]
MNDVVIRARGLERSFAQAGARLKVLEGVDLEIRAGEQVAILGPSGVGKSTLLHLLGGLDRPTSGSVEVAGQDMARADETRRAAIRNRHLGFVYQFHHLLPEFTALENVAMPLLIARQPVAQARARAVELLERVGLGHRLDHKPGQLSGGERQRAAVARALINRPACILGDEPTGNLDEDNAAQVYELMLELNREFRTSLVLVTHDPQLARRMDRRLEMTGGRLVDMD